MNSGQARRPVIVRGALLVCLCALGVPSRAQQPAPSADAGKDAESHSIPGESRSAENSQPEPAQRDRPGEDSKAERSAKLQSPTLADFNQDIYYRNKLEFALDGGYFPVNIPFPFDLFEGDPYDLYPLRYTLVPIVVSIRWHIDSIGGRWIFRGNWDMTASFSATAIPRGAETHYFSYDMGVRRNFVRRNSKIAPYTDMRLGLGIINAKGPLGVYYAQGQNYTFTANLGAGVRYNFNPKYGISAGLNWMHISNNNLSAPAYSNYGINVYGPQFGLNIQLGRGRRHASE
jgi:Lipid A 3-O-deacylase (PagL)